MALLGNVDTVQELTDILVSGLTDLLDVGSILRNLLDRVTRENDLILLSGGELNLNTLSNWDQSDLLVTQVVSDLDELLTILLNNIDIDREVRIDISHLVLVTSSDTSDHVVNKRLDSSQSSNVLSVTVVDSDLDQSVVDLGEGDINVLQVLGQDTSWTSDLDDSGLDVNGNVLRNVDALLSLNVLHLSVKLSGILGRFSCVQAITICSKFLRDMRLSGDLEVSTHDVVLP